MQFCTRCGTGFSDDVMPEPGYAGPAGGRPRPRAVVLAVAGVVLLAGVGVGAWFLTARHNSPPRAVEQGNSRSGGPVSAQPTAGSLVAGGSQAPGSPDPGSAAPGTPSAGGATQAGTAPPGPVTIATAITGNAAAPQIAAFLDDYFGAINNHDYQAYVALRSPQAAGISPAQFVTGYGSTTDTGETLQGISSAANGDLIADVTFTSRQSAAESATKSNCTDWNISLYLVPDGGGYLIDNPPSGYHARYASCG
jgi:hypothetical protein